MAIEVSSPRSVCSKCGTAYGRQKGYFPVSYATLHKGVGHTHVCRNCIDSMYSEYLSQCHNAADAVRQICRKLDLYWNETVFKRVERQNTTRTMMTQYLAKINSVTYAGKCYDDTLLEEGTLWNFANNQNEDKEDTEETKAKIKNEIDEETEIIVPDEIKDFWGPGLEPTQYEQLEQRRKYWVSRLPKDMEFDIGTEVLIKQLCSLELDINRDRASGRSVEKSINALISLLGSAELKPTQKKNSEVDSIIEKTPFGVWIRKWENELPVPDVDPELKDVDGIIKYVTTWFYGHTSKMMGKTNIFCKLYEKAIAKMRVEHPEYDDEDDETFFNNIFDSEEVTDDESEGQASAQGQGDDAWQELT